MLRLVVLVLYLVVFPVSAQTVQKCVGRDGHITLTSGGCPDGQWEAASYAATPERITPEQARRAAELERWQQSQAARLASSGSTYRPPRRPSSSDNRHARCQAAKRYRDQQLERLGLRRTHADLRRFDDAVYQACK